MMDTKKTEMDDEDWRSRPIQKTIAGENIVGTTRFRHPKYMHFILNNCITYITGE